MKEQRMKCKLTSQLEYQLRFFKITRRGRNNKVNPLQQQSSNRKFNNLPLPTNYIEKIQAYNQF